ncbi:glycosyltransferase [Streptacidiphilus sp. MAP12-20]|uniref:glycosyltransferase n=1 Tax=Streptacidiphilus sp. MAP12-20 TaxID=3156299 RepID=UPI0035157950
MGPSWLFTGGLSQYTCRLARALAEETEVSALLMRRLLPKRLYPGRARVGAKVASSAYDPRVEVYDGVDWYWIPSLLGGLRWLRRRHPDLVVFQWWTGTVAHSYLVLAAAARSFGAKVVIEFHELQDTGEAKVPATQAYTGWILSRLVRRADSFIVHSAYDRSRLSKLLDLTGQPVAVVPHGPFDQYAVQHAPSRDGTVRLLFFGLIRPYKGLEYLLSAFDRLSAQEVAGFHLTVVGETWEGCTAPIRMIERAEHRDRITLVNRYVTDDEAKHYFAHADVLVLPYLRCSASGPLHIAMSNGLPVLMSRVGGLAEAARDYPGAVMVEPADVDALVAGLRTVRGRVGGHYRDPHSWRRNVDALLACSGQDVPEAAP